jgi:hypothetical protein
MQALRIRTTIKHRGELRLPLPELEEGTPVEVIVLVGSRDEVEVDLSLATEETLDFWDNEVDDRVWNDA